MKVREELNAKINEDNDNRLFEEENKILLIEIKELKNKIEYQ